MKRFIPSEFGFNTRPGKISHPVVEGLPYMLAKREVVDYLETLAAGNKEGNKEEGRNKKGEKVGNKEGFTWTGLATGVWVDWVCFFYFSTWIV